ncbi:hypothetical protein VDG1235_2634 [Verrucomicrobiia bacterium DG1235]|nr:hypothetical protein VDG1235_2634 [Verrucomicrobiae bacterium DG1235]
MVEVSRLFEFHRDVVKVASDHRHYACCPVLTFNNFCSS